MHSDCRCENPPTLVPNSSDNHPAHGEQRAARPGLKRLTLGAVAIRAGARQQPATAVGGCHTCWVGVSAPQMTTRHWVYTSGSAIWTAEEEAALEQATKQCVAATPAHHHAYHPGP